MPSDTDICPYCGYPLLREQAVAPCPECGTSPDYHGAPATWPPRARNLFRRKIWYEIAASSAMAVAFITTLIIDALGINAETDRIVVCVNYGVAALCAAGFISLGTQTTIEHNFPPLRSLWAPRGRRRAARILSPVAVALTPMLLALGVGEPWFSAPGMQWILIVPTALILLDVRTRLAYYNSIVNLKRCLRWHRTTAFVVDCVMAAGLVALVGLAGAASVGIYPHDSIAATAMSASFAHVVLGCGFACALPHVPK